MWGAGRHVRIQIHLAPMHYLSSMELPPSLIEGNDSGFGATHCPNVAGMTNFLVGSASYLNSYDRRTWDYRLVHCPIDTDVVDFAELFELFDRKPEVRRHTEIAALHERHIRIFDESWWAGPRQREVTSILPVLQLRSGSSSAPSGRGERVIPRFIMGCGRKR